MSHLGVAGRVCTDLIEINRRASVRCQMSDWICIHALPLLSTASSDPLGQMALTTRSQGANARATESNKGEVKVSVRKEEAKCLTSQSRHECPRCDE